MQSDWSVLRNWPNRSFKWVKTHVVACWIRAQQIKQIEDLSRQSNLFISVKQSNNIRKQNFQVSITPESFDVLNSHNNHPLQNEAQLCCSMLDRPWGPMYGNLSSDKSQRTNETCRTKILLFGEQRSTNAGKDCLSECVDVCDDGWGSVIVSYSQQLSTFCYTHL